MEDVAAEGVVLHSVCQVKRKTTGPFLPTQLSSQLLSGFSSQSEYQLLLAFFVPTGAGVPAGLSRA